MDGNVVIKNASELVTCSGQTAKTGRAMSDLAVINGGAVSIENGVITRVGRTDEVIRGLDLSGFEVIDATGKAVLPGLIDCHTHFLFAGYRADEFAWRLSGLSYMEIMERAEASAGRSRRRGWQRRTSLSRKAPDGSTTCSPSVLRLVKAKAATAWTIRRR